MFKVFLGLDRALARVILMLKDLDCCEPVTCDLRVKREHFIFKWHRTSLDERGGLELKNLISYLLQNMRRLNSWVVSQLALIIGTLCHILGHEFKPHWQQNLFRTQAQHRCFIHDSIWFIWFDTICLSNLSCELWHRILKIKDFFKNCKIWNWIKHHRFCYNKSCKQIGNNCLSRPSCGPWFECQAQHLHFFLFFWIVMWKGLK